MDQATQRLLMAAGGGSKTISFVASASANTTSAATSLAVSKPTGTQENDLMIAFMGADKTATFTGDTGWTEIADQGASPSLRIAYKVATASEGSSYTFTSSGSVNIGASILTYRNATYDTIGTIVTAANPLLPSLPTVGTDSSYAVGFAVRAANSITLTAPVSMTTRVTDNGSVAPSYVIADESVNAGASGTRSFSTGSTTNVAAVLLVIKPG